MRSKQPTSIHRMIDEAVERLRQRTGYVYVIPRMVGSREYMRPQYYLAELRRELGEDGAKSKS